MNGMFWISRTQRRIDMKNLSLREVSVSIALFALAIFLFPACEVAQAAELPPGSYLQSCQGAQMRGSTLTASCTNYFGAPQLASLPDADYCNSTGHDIANVNGFLRCIFHWDPNGIGVISRSKDEIKGGNVIKIWRIDQPMVTSPTPVPYPDISFKSGDTITINAGGCVQTGGSGSTWKSYTAPQGDSANTLYSGTIEIPGVIGSGIPVRIGGVLPREWHVPFDLQPPVLKQLYLRLGYEDDYYPDNGYYAHDNGNNNQCANVGPAWVEIKIVRSLKTPDDDKQSWTPASKPFDLIWDAEDTQGLPLNPRWFIQKNDPRREVGFDAPCSSAVSGGDINLGLLYSNCTTQMPTMDLFGGWLFTLCRPPGHIFAGHLNWMLATTMGMLQFNNWSNNGFLQDDDFNLNLIGPDNSLRLLTTEAGDGPGLSLEFNANESIDQFQTPWWAGLASAAESGGTAPANSPLGELTTGQGKRAVVIGLIGIDGVHASHTESHPVFAMAVESASREDKDSRLETWDFFVRNFGNEGNCSELIHYWEGLGGRYYVQLPTPPQWGDVVGVKVDASEAWLVNESLIALPFGTAGRIAAASHQGNASVAVEKDSQATYLAVSLPTPVETGSDQVGWGINGEVTIHYALNPNRMHRDEAKREEPVNQAARPRTKSEDKEANSDEVLKNLSDPAVRQQVQKIFSAAFSGVAGGKPTSKRILIDSVVHDHKPVLGVHHGAPTRPHRARDPRKTNLKADLEHFAGIKAPGKNSTAPRN
jgi:hypothetical protein